MKIRNGYVSNSSSSSFIVFGPNAKRFCDSIEDGKLMNIFAVADCVWWNFLYNFRRNQEVEFIPDSKWKNSFPDGDEFIYTLPKSIKDNSIISFKEYKNAFRDWFERNYNDCKFYEIEFSDHPGETKYSEEDMEVYVYDYKNNYDKKCFTTNNH